MRLKLLFIHILEPIIHSAFFSSGQASTFVLFIPATCLEWQNGIMKKCLFFFLGLIAALALAVLSGFNTGVQKEQRIKAALEEETAQADGLATKMQNKPAALYAPVKKAPWNYQTGT